MVHTEFEFDVRMGAIWGAMKRIRARLEGVLGTRLVWHGYQDETTTRYYLARRRTWRRPFPNLHDFCCFAPYMNTAHVYCPHVYAAVLKEMAYARGVLGGRFTIWKHCE